MALISCSSGKLIILTKTGNCYLQINVIKSDYEKYLLFNSPTHFHQHQWLCGQSGNGQTGSGPDVGTK